MGRAERSYYEDLLNAGVKIYKYNAPILLHSKTMSIDDDMAVIGSSNLDMRSFQLNLEVTLICYASQVVADLRQIEANYMRKSKQVNLKEWKTRSAGKILFENISRLTAALQFTIAEKALAQVFWLMQHRPPWIGPEVPSAERGRGLKALVLGVGPVDLLELAPRLIPQEDEDIALALAGAFSKQRMTVITGAGTERLEKTDGGIRVHYRKQERPASLTVGAVFFATGWPGNVDALNLAAAGVVTERSYIPVNDYLQSNVPYIFAAGDINGQSMLVQSARYEGRIAAENAVLGPYRRFTHEIVPSGSFTDPEYASVGLTEAQARQEYDCAVAVVHYDDLLRPVADGHPEGFCKLIVDRRNRYILGAHVIGEYSVEIIQMVAACIASGTRVEQVAELQLAYPTFTEAVGMAAQKLVRELGLAPLPQLWSDIK